MIVIAMLLHCLESTAQRIDKMPQCCSVTRHVSFDSRTPACYLKTHTGAAIVLFSVKKLRKMIPSKDCYILEIDRILYAAPVSNFLPDAVGTWRSVL